MGFVSSAHQNVGKGTGGRTKKCNKKYVPAKVDGIDIEPQHNNWSCGPMSLRYCLARLGRDVSVEDIAELAYSTRAGTGELKLQRAAHVLGYHWHSHTLITAKSAKDTIERLLKRGHALILCVEKWKHWVACLHHSHRGYLIFDSSRPGPVVQLHGWNWVRKRLRYVPSETGDPIYYIASVSRKPVQRTR